MSTTCEDGWREALRWLASRPDFERRTLEEQSASRWPLERPALLLERMGRPDRRYGIILVAGTKGKGSTACLAASVLRAHGLRVGLYTQPHLHSYRERLRVNGIPISTQDLAEGLERVRPLVESLDVERAELGPLTMYEVTTALGLDWFARQGVQWAVVEVGLGGRLDATNVVNPSVAVITPISYDHQHILGRRLAQIAAEKAGIVKDGGLVVSAPQRPAAMAAIRQAARERRARLVVAGRTPGAVIAGRLKACRLRADGVAASDAPFVHFAAASACRSYPDLTIGLGGEHQVTNALTALTALEMARTQGLELRPEAVRAGLATARWPGRLEVAGMAPAIVIDGAHNGDSAQHLRTALALHFDFARLLLVVGVLSDKNLSAIIRPLGDAQRIFAVAPGTPRARSADEVARFCRRSGLQAIAAGSVAEGLAAARSAAGPRDLICVTGSLSVVAEAREALGLAEREDWP